MASPSSSHPMSRRDSSTRSNSNSNKTRPRLLRASATEPAITNSNIGRVKDDTAKSSWRATDLLSRVAFFSSSPPDSVIRPSSPMSSRDSMFDSMDQHSDLSASPISHSDGFDDLRHQSYSGRYYSFPSFDMYEEDQQDEQKENQPKSP